MDSYETLLDKLYSELPDKAKEKSRFKMPVFDSFIQGNQTFVANFVDVASSLRREVKHLSKYLFKELATPGTLDKKRLILKAKVRERYLNEKLQSYIKTFVLCKECNKPDTDILDQGGVQILHCQACGARSPIPTVK